MKRLFRLQIYMIFPNYTHRRIKISFKIYRGKDNILTVNSKPRNRRVMEVLEKTGEVERSGQGVDKMFYICLMEGKPLPDYSHKVAV